VIKGQTNALLRLEHSAPTNTTTTATTKPTEDSQAPHAFATYNSLPNTIAFFPIPLPHESILTGHYVTESQVRTGHPSLQSRPLSTSWTHTLADNFLTGPQQLPLIRVHLPYSEYQKLPEDTSDILDDKTTNEIFSRSWVP